MQATTGKTIEAIAGLARHACQTGKRLTPRYLRNSLGREPTVEEFHAMRREVARQTALWLERQKRRGTYLGRRPDPLAARKPGSLAARAAWRAKARAEANAIDSVLDGARDRKTLAAAGLAHLAGQRVKTRRGSYGIVERIPGYQPRAYALTAWECKVLGLAPGPANYL